MDASEGFDISLILPAKTNKAKLYKKLLKVFPKGTKIIITPNDETLNLQIKKEAQAT